MARNNFNLKYRILVLVGALLISQVLLILVTVIKARDLLDNLNSVTTQELPATRYITYSDMLHDGIRAVVMEALYADSQKEKGRLESLRKEAEDKSQQFVTNIKKLYELNLSKSTKDDLIAIQQNVFDYGSLGMSIVNALQASDYEGLASEKKKFEEVFNYLEEHLEKVSKKIAQDASTQGDKGKDIVQTVFIISAFTLIFSLIVGVVIFVWTKKSFDFLLKNVVSSTKNMTSLSDHVAKESLKVKDSAVAQSAAIQESVAALNEMSSMIIQTGSNIKLSLETAEEAQEKVNVGKQVMDNMTVAMSSIQKANSQMEEIAEVINNIRNKTAIINEIVFKTQLLSFNASIEAARAGQHGRGFAVVAEEVGNLAELSGLAANDIEVLIAQSQSKVQGTLEIIRSRVSDANRVSQQALHAFTEISGRIELINSQVKSINEATNQQAIGIDQTNTAMRQMDQSSQSNTEASGQALEKAKGLRTQCNEMNGVTSNLLKLVSGDDDLFKAA